MVCDGKAGPGFPSMVCDPIPPFVYGSRHLVYHGIIGNDERLVIDDWQGPEGLAIMGKGISPDSRHILIAVRAGARRMLFLDGLPVEEFGTLEGVAWSVDLRHVAWAVRQQGQEWVTVNRRPGPQGQRVIWGSTLKFAKDASLTYLLVSDSKVWRIRHRPAPAATAPAAPEEGSRP